MQATDIMKLIYFWVLRASLCLTLPLQGQLSSIWRTLNESFFSSSCIPTSMRMHLLMLMQLSSPYSTVNQVRDYQLWRLRDAPGQQALAAFSAQPHSRSLAVAASPVAPNVSCLVDGPCTAQQHMPCPTEDSQHGRPDSETGPAAQCANRSGLSADLDDRSSPALLAGPSSSGPDLEPGLSHRRATMACTSGTTAVSSKSGQDVLARRASSNGCDPALADDMSNVHPARHAAPEDELAVGRAVADAVGQAPDLVSPCH